MCPNENSCCGILMKVYFRFISNSESDFFFLLIALYQTISNHGQLAINSYHIINQKNVTNFKVTKI